MICECCFDTSIPIYYKCYNNENNENNEYKSLPYCKDCVNIMLETQFQSYVKSIETETCKKSLYRLLKNGPPEYLKYNEEYIYELKIGDEILSGKLRNIYTGEDLENYKLQIANLFKNLFEIEN